MLFGARIEKDKTVGVLGLDKEKGRLQLAATRKRNGNTACCGARLRFKDSLNHSPGARMRTMKTMKSRWIHLVIAIAVSPISAYVIF